MYSRILLPFLSISFFTSWVFLLSFLFPHSQFLHSLSLPSLASPPSPMCHPDESSALLQFKNSFSVGNGSKTVCWQNGTNCCEWEGVSCDSISCHVTELNLTLSFLRGPLHSNSTLFSLRHLESLIIDKDVDFCGSPIPPEIGGFTNMTFLSLSYTNFTGNVPRELSHLSKLVSVIIVAPEDYYKFDLKLENYVFKRVLQNLTNLEQLTLIGLDMAYVKPVPSLMNISSALQGLWIDSCQLHGNFAEKKFHLPSLRELLLINNFGNYKNFNLVCSLPRYNWSSSLEILGLSDTKIPIDLPYLMRSAKSLQLLYLCNCIFTGSYRQLTIDGTNSSQIPIPLNLTCLSLSANLLSGFTPSWIFSLPSLEILDLGHNHFTGCLKDFKSRSLTNLILSGNKLNGQIPSSVFQQVYLKRLSLSGNQLTGEIPPVVCHMSTLRLLDLSNNSFHGNIPSCLGNQHRLSVLDLKINKLNGVIPDMFANSTQLRSLHLRANELEGPLPQSLRNLTNLEWLDLSSNELVGEIPGQLTDLTQLAFLNLSRNKFERPIPGGWQFNTFNNDSYCGNLGLCGFPLSTSCSNDTSPHDQGDDEGDQQNRRMIDWKVVMMGYGNGLVITISVGYMVFFRRSIDYWFLKRFRGERKHIPIPPLRDWRAN